MGKYRRVVIYIFFKKPSTNGKTEKKRQKIRNKDNWIHIRIKIIAMSSKKKTKPKTSRQEKKCGNEL